MNLFYYLILKDKLYIFYNGLLGEERCIAIIGI
jgi:hypothetical protein